MSTVNFGVPEDVKQAFNAAFEGLAPLQGGQAGRAARSSKPEHQNRALADRKQRFLTALHNCGAA